MSTFEPSVMSLPGLREQHRAAPAARRLILVASSTSGQTRSPKAHGVFREATSTYDVTVGRTLRAAQNALSVESPANLDGRCAMLTEDVRLATSDGELSAYLATAGQAAGSRPGVIVLHELFGLNDDIRRIARRFADHGYVALAPGPVLGRSRPPAALHPPHDGRAAQRHGSRLRRHRGRPPVAGGTARGRCVAPGGGRILHGRRVRHPLRRPRADRRRGGLLRRRPEGARGDRGDLPGGRRLRWPGPRLQQPSRTVARPSGGTGRGTRDHDLPRCRPLVHEPVRPDCSRCWCGSRP